MRLFVGIPLPDDIRARLGGLSGGFPGARWVDPGNLHISLRFIGEVAGGDEIDIDQALQDVVGEAFEVTLAGVGCFDRRGRVHVVWAGIENPEALTRLQGKVESALVNSGLEPEHRKYKPHVTLARMKNGLPREAAAFMEVHDGFQEGPFAIDCFTLFRSHLGSSGAHYETLADYPLGAFPSSED